MESAGAQCAGITKEDRGLTWGMELLSWTGLCVMKRTPGALLHMWLHWRPTGSRA